MNTQHIAYFNPHVYNVTINNDFCYPVKTLQLNVISLIRQPTSNSNGYRGRTLFYCLA
jgi:hypothetical protein